MIVSKSLFLSAIIDGMEIEAIYSVGNAEMRSPLGWVLAWCVQVEAMYASLPVP